MQPTVADPPAVEYVAVGRWRAWVVGLLGRVVGGAVVGTGAATRGGWATAPYAPGGGACAGGPAGGGAPGGTVDVDPPALGTVMSGSVSAWGSPGCSASTTSRWATTGGGRSVRSAATVDVPAHTIAVATAVTHSQRATARNRRTGTGTSMPRGGGDGG